VFSSKSARDLVWRPTPLEITFDAACQAAIRNELQRLGTLRKPLRATMRMPRRIVLTTTVARDLTTDG
jgi:hypothetical protein